MPPDKSAVPAQPDTGVPDDDARPYYWHRSYYGSARGSQEGDQDGPPPGLNILFVHIPKTAGVSLYRALEAWATPQRSIRFERGGATDIQSLEGLAAERLARLRLVAGHITLRGFRRRLVGEWLPITVLRDPVERALSLYSFVRGEPDHPWFARASEMGLAEFLAWYRDEPFSVNQMCLFICNEPDPQLAYRTLTHHFGLACSVEHLPAMVERLSELIEHPLVLSRHNVSQRRITPSEVDAEILAAIEAADSADRILFERVREAGLVGHRAAPAVGGT